MAIYNNLRCDVAVVGAGPVGIATACLIKAFNPDKELLVIDKRRDTTRDHGLYIDKDAIDKIHRVCLNYLKSPAKTAASERDVRDLMALTARWKKRVVRTSMIERDLATFAQQRLGVRVIRDPNYEIHSRDFDQFLQSTGAQVVIGADGAKSQVREAIGAEKREEKPLGYLLELKYSTDPNRRAWGKLDSSLQAYKTEGWDFITEGRARPEDQFKRISLHKFINGEVHQGLLERRGDILKGSNEHPWTLKELEQRARIDEHARFIFNHIQNYLSEYEFENERIVTFPMVLYRSSFVAKKIGDQVVVLAGDASSGSVLARGANKGLIEAAMCAETVHQYIAKAPQKGEELPKEFQDYQQATQALYNNEKWWAEWKNFGLEMSEILLKCVTRPIKWIFSVPKLVWTKIKG